MAISMPSVFYLGVPCMCPALFSFFFFFFPSPPPPGNVVMTDNGEMVTLKAVMMGWIRTPH